MAHRHVGVECRLCAVDFESATSTCGMFRAMQLAAAKALEAGEDWYASNNQNYRNRRQLAERLWRLCNARTTIIRWACSSGENTGLVHGRGGTHRKVLHQARVFIARIYFRQQRCALHTHLSLLQRRETGRKRWKELKNE